MDALKVILTSRRYLGNSVDNNTGGESGKDCFFLCKTINEPKFTNSMCQGPGPYFRGLKCMIMVHRLGSRLCVGFGCAYLTSSTA